MKKFIAILSVILSLCMLSGCAGTPVVYQTNCSCPTANVVVTEDNKESAAPVETAAEGELKTGLALIAALGDSAAATAENNGKAAYDVTVVAVLVDNDNIIRDCIIDGVKFDVKFDANGQITTDLTTAPQTKNELGENYNMVKYGGAVAEWDAQASSLANFAVGKTPEELRSGAIDETGYAPKGSDLSSSATIYLGGYVSAIEAAAKNAVNLGAQSGDVLHMATINGIDSSKSADAENFGTAQLDVTATAMSMKDGVITSCLLDSVQAKVNFNTAGEITSDLNAPVQTKNQLGENYGMVKYAGAIADWDAQAASFAAYVTGKSVDEVAGIAVNEKTAPADADLASTVTIAIGGFQALLQKAAK